MKYVSDKGMMNGVGGNKFAPSASATCVEVAAILMRYCEK